MRGILVDYGQPTGDLMLEENWTLPLLVAIVTNSSAGSGNPSALPQTMLEYWLAWSYVCDYSCS